MSLPTAEEEEVVEEVGEAEEEAEEEDGAAGHLQEDPPLHGRPGASQVTQSNNGVQVKEVLPTPK